MASNAYQYSSEPTRNPFRWLLAAWRVSRDLTNTNEAAIVEIGFSRSRLGRRFAGWQQVASELARDSRLADVLVERHRLGIDLSELAKQPPGSLGAVFAAHCQARSMNPNLVSVPADDEADFVMAHLFETHDIWHVVTGWNNDELGEIGLGGFYLAQLGLPLIALMLALILLNTVFCAPGTLRTRMEALVIGYQMGKAAQPLFGTRWDQLWSMPVSEIRNRFALQVDRVLSQGDRAAA